MPTAQTAQSGLVAWSQLIGLVGQAVPQPIAKEIVAQAWRNICRQRRWSFLRAEGYLVAPAAIQGSVTFTRALTTATADSALRALIETPSTDPLVGIGKMAIRDAEDVIYQIRAYDSSNGQITLDKPYLGTTGARSITIFRQYYTPPISEVSENGTNVESGNFRAWLSIVDVGSNQRWINYRNSEQWLNLIDPARRRTGEPSQIVQAPYDVLGLNIASTGTPLFELWPHYVGNTAKIYQCRFVRDYIPLSDEPGQLTNVLPIAIPLRYLMAQARFDAYEWAEANKGDYPKLQKTNWLQLLSPAGPVQQRLTEEYLAAQAADEERYPEDVDNSTRMDQYNSWGYGQNVMPGPYFNPYFN